MGSILVKAEQRDVLLVPFPFSDLSGSKVRPVVVLSKNGFNNNSEDVIVCGITSNVNKDRYTIEIADQDMESGRVFTPCCVKVENVLKLSKTLIVKRIGKLRPESFAKVMGVLRSLFE